MSKKQDCTAMSSAEAEYVALSASCDQVRWMRIQLKDYGFNYNKITLYCDSQSAIAISCNPVTEYQLADMFTKALLEDRFQFLVRRIGMRCLTPAELEDSYKDGDGDASFQLKSDLLPHDDDSKEDQDEDGDDSITFDMWDITVEDVERIRKIFNVPNKIDKIVQPLIPEPIQTKPPNDD
ncbi:hypothetical protein Tco_0844173 [Tanacetum coccineum]